MSQQEGEMTLAKAIEIITKLRRDYLYTFNQDPIDALGLGIKALKFLRQLQADGVPEALHYLPGETKEQSENKAHE